MELDTIAAIDELSSLLRASLRRGTRESILLLGPNTVDKASILDNELARIIPELPKPPIIVKHRVELYPTDMFSLQHIATEVNRQLQNPLPSPDRTGAASDAAFVEFLRAALIAAKSEKRRVILIIDDFELLCSEAGASKSSMYVEPKSRVFQKLLYNLSDLVHVGDTYFLLVGLSSQYYISNYIEKRVVSRMLFKEVFLTHSFLSASYIFSQTLQKMIVGKKQEYIPLEWRDSDRQLDNSVTSLEPPLKKSTLLKTNLFNISLACENINDTTMSKDEEVAILSLAYRFATSTFIRSFQCSDGSVMMNSMKLALEKAFFDDEPEEIWERELTKCESREYLSQFLMATLTQFITSRKMCWGSALLASGIDELVLNNELYVPCADKSSKILEMFTYFDSKITEGTSDQEFFDNSLTILKSLYVMACKTLILLPGSDTPQPLSSMTQLSLPTSLQSSRAYKKWLEIEESISTAFWNCGCQWKIWLSDLTSRSINAHMMSGVSTMVNLSSTFSYMLVGKTLDAFSIDEQQAALLYNKIDKPLQEHVKVGLSSLNLHSAKHFVNDMNAQQSTYLSTRDELITRTTLNDIYSHISYGGRVFLVALARRHRRLEYGGKIQTALLPGDLNPHRTFHEGYSHAELTLDGVWQDCSNFLKDANIVFSKSSLWSDIIRLCELGLIRLLIVMKSGEASKSIIRCMSLAAIRRVPADFVPIWSEASVAFPVYKDLLTVVHGWEIKLARWASSLE